MTGLLVGSADSAAPAAPEAGLAAVKVQVNEAVVATVATGAAVLLMVVVEAAVTVESRAAMAVAKAAVATTA